MSEHDALIESELRTVDDALASGALTAESERERELQALALALAADAPEPDPRFSEELSERVREGFPRARRPRQLALPKLRRPPMLALAGAASILAAVAVAVPLLSSTGDDPSTGEAAQPGSSPKVAESDQAPDAAGAGAAVEQPRESIAPALKSPSPSAGAGASAPPPGGFAPGQRVQRIERSASLTLAAPADGLDRVADGIIAVTDRYRGFVLRSSVSTGDEGTTGGSFELRIPSDQLQPALRDLSKLGDVRARSQAGQDVTRDFVSAQDRLEAARVERRGLLRRLEDADTDTEAEALRSRLDANAAEVNGLRGQLRDLRLRTEYATVSVALEDSGGDSNDGSVVGGSEGGGLRDAVDDALSSLAGSVEILVRILGVAIPLGLLAGLAWLAARAVRRRRRESALSG